MLSETEQIERLRQRIKENMVNTIEIENKVYELEKKFEKSPDYKALQKYKELKQELALLLKDTKEARAERQGLHLFLNGINIVKAYYT